MCVGEGGQHQSPQAVFQSCTYHTHYVKPFLWVNQINKNTCSDPEDVQELVADLEEHKIGPELIQWINNGLITQKSANRFWAMWYRHELLFVEHTVSGKL